MIVVLYWCVKYSPPTGLATWDSSTGLILLFRLFSTYFKTILYWYKWYRFRKPSNRRDQPCTYLGNLLSMSGDIPQDLCVATIYKAFQQATSYKPRSTRRHLQATSYTTTTPCYNLQATSHYTVASVTTFATRLFALCRSLHNKMSS